MDRKNAAVNGSKELKEIILSEVTPHSRRSRSNVTNTFIPYAKKPITRDTHSDFGNESTTIGMNSEMDSPLIRGTRQGLSLDTS